jgi:hypothetical protein
MIGRGQPGPRARSTRCGTDLLTAQHPEVQVDGLGRRIKAKLLGQAVPKCVEGAQRRGLVAGCRVRPDQKEVRCLSQRLGFNGLLRQCHRLRPVVQGQGCGGGGLQSLFMGVFADRHAGPDLGVGVDAGARVDVRVGVDP